MKFSFYNFSELNRTLSNLKALFSNRVDTSISQLTFQDDLNQLNTSVADLTKTVDGAKVFLQYVTDFTGK